MPDGRRGDLDSEPGNSAAFQIDEKHRPAYQRLQQILLELDTPIAQCLREGRAGSWSPADMEGLKSAICSRLSSARRFSPLEFADDQATGDLAIELKSLMDALAQVVDEVIRNTRKEAPRPQYFRRVPLETNPFHTDIGAAAQTLEELKFLVGRGLGNQSLEDEDAIALGLLSSISNFQLLDPNQQVAWLEALARRSADSVMLQKHCCMPLEVAFYNQLNAERRLYIADKKTSRLINNIDDTAVQSVINYLNNETTPVHSSKSTTQHRQAIKKRIIQYLGDIVARFAAAHGVAEFTLSGATEAARTFAYLNLPAAVAAHRCRKTISHSPRIQVIRRIYSGIPLKSSGEPSVSDVVDDLESIALTEAELHDSSELEPEWYIAMRAAFRLSAKAEVRTRLAEVAKGSGPTGACIAEFALDLLKQHAISTARRYSLVIARRLGCRLDGSDDHDPRQLSTPELESLYEEILDEDQESASENVDGLRGYEKRPIVMAIAKFHRYLQRQYNVGELTELKHRLRPIGLLPVDANFITIDEYLHVLTEVDRNIDDQHIRSAIKLFVSICFWCGLRREEARGLRASDFDAAGHVHIRPHRERKLKTSNARRTIPIAILMPEDRYRDLVKWVRERADAPRSGDFVMLFSDRTDASRLLPGSSFYKMIIAILRSAVRDDSLNIHHLRHSFATLLAAKLLPGTRRFTSILFSANRHPRTEEWLQTGHDLRLKLFGNSQIRKHDFAGIAHMLGHGSPAISLEHYVHCLDWYSRNNGS
jgi:integrase